MAKEKTDPFSILKLIIPAFLLLMAVAVFAIRRYPLFCLQKGKEALMAGDTAGALVWLERAEGDEKETLLREAYRIGGEDRLRAGDLAGALEAFSAAGMETVPQQERDRLYLGLADAAATEGRFAEAGEHLKNVSPSAAVKQRMTEYSLALAEEAAAAGDYDTAIALAEGNGEDTASLALRHELRVRKAEAMLVAGEYDAAEPLILSLMEEGTDAGPLYVAWMRGKETEACAAMTDEQILLAATERINEEETARGRFEERTKHVRKGILAAGNLHSLAVRADGTVLATGDNTYGQCDVAGWSNIVAVAAGAFHSVGLRADGTVVATGDDRYGQCDVAEYTGIRSIVAHTFDTVLLKEDGTVISLGRNRFNADMTSVPKLKEAALGSYALVGFKTDGGVYASVSGLVDDRFRSAVAIDAALNYAVGLKADGTLLTGALSCPDYTDVIAMDACSGGICVLLGDGTVRYWSFREGDTGDFGWEDICAVAASGTHFIGMKGDGTFVARGDNGCGQCDVSAWHE